MTSLRVLGGSAVAEAPHALLVVPERGDPDQGRPTRVVITASGTAPFTYQWFQDGFPVPGQTSSVLKIPPYRLALRSTYHARVENPHGAAVSPPARLPDAWSEDLRIPWVNMNFWLRQPAVAPPYGIDATLRANRAEVILRYTLDGSRPSPSSHAYREPLSFPSSATLRASGFIDDFQVTGEVMQDFPYPTTMSELPCIVTLDRETLRRSGLSQIVVVAGSFVTFEWNSSDIEPLHGVLFHEGRPIYERTFTNRFSCALGPVPVEARGPYHAVFSRPSGVVSVTRTVVLVTTAPPPPIIDTQPSPIAAGAENTVSFQVGASGIGHLSYQWFHDGFPVPNATSAVFRLRYVQSQQAGSYRVRVSNGGGSVDSELVSLRIVPPPRIVALDVTPNPRAGRPLEARIRFESEGQPLVFWGRDLEPLSPTEDPACLVIPEAIPGRYWVTISGPGGHASADIADVAEARWLEVSSTPGGTVRAPAREWHPLGSSVTLEAVPDPGYGFVEWLGDSDLRGNPARFVMDRNRAVSAVFTSTSGTVHLLNYLAGTDLDARVYDVDGVTPLAGPAFLAQLHAGPRGGELRPMGQPVPFRDGAGAGYLLGDVVLVTTVAAGQRADVQLRAWEAAAGDSYDLALERQGRHGESHLLAVDTGNFGVPPSLPAHLDGLRSFRLRPGILPAPSVALHRLRAGTDAPDADPDQDGLPNLLEYLMGTSPWIPDTERYPRPERLRNEAGHVLAFLIPRRRDLANEARLQLEASEDLLRWTPVDPIVDILASGETTDLLRLRDPGGPTASRNRFLRMLVRLGAR